MNTEKNYNGVEITKSWSFLAFAKEYGMPKFAKCTNKETGEIFNTIAFVDDNEKVTFCHFGYSTAGMTPQEIRDEKNSLKVGLNTSGKYTLYKEGNGAWEDLLG